MIPKSNYIILLTISSKYISFLKKKVTLFYCFEDYLVDNFSVKSTRGDNAISEPGELKMSKKMSTTV